MQKPTAGCDRERDCNGAVWDCAAARRLLEWETRRADEGVWRGAMRRLTRKTLQSSTFRRQAGLAQGWGGDFNLVDVQVDEDR